MLEKLTPEMESKIIPTRDYWINKFYFNPNPLDLDEAKTTEFVNWVYSLAKLEPPKVVIASSPLHAQNIANELGGFPKGTYNTPSSAIGISNYGWVAYYDFFTQIEVINHSDFNRYKEYSDLNIYDSIQFEKLCIVTKLPSTVKSTIRNGVRVPHCADGPAIQFEDGFSIYFWNGAIVPEKWIMDQDSLTKQDIVSTENAELRRCLMEILGAKRYYDILTDGNGLELLDEDNDLQGNPMRLYSTKNPDDITGNKIQFLEVVDPSTGRVYNIYPPGQNATNVWDAKAQTFDNKNLFVRQGDVGLVKSGFDGTAPVVES